MRIEIRRRGTSPSGHHHFGHPLRCFTRSYNGACGRWWQIVVPGFMVNVIFDPYAWDHREPLA